MANCLYVAPNGDDKAKGTIDAPFKTLQAALKCVKTLGESCWDGEITVYLRGVRNGCGILRSYELSDHVDSDRI